MGRQVEFFANNDDVRDLLEWCERKGLFAIPQSIPVQSIPPVVPPTAIKVKRSDRSWFYLWCGDADPDLVAEWYATNTNLPGVAVIFRSESPVIQLCAGPMRGSRIMRGRVYLTSEAGVRFPDVLKAYTSLSRYLKKWETLDGGRHVGPRTRAALRTGTISLIYDGGDELHPTLAVDPSWLTIPVRKLARVIHQERSFDRLPVLADALEEAGCASEDILAHCRSNTEHEKNCWVTELLVTHS